MEGPSKLRSQQIVGECVPRVTRGVCPESGTIVTQFTHPTVSRQEKTTTNATVSHLGNLASVLPSQTVGGCRVDKISEDLVDILEELGDAGGIVGLYFVFFFTRNSLIIYMNEKMQWSYFISKG